MPNFIDRTGHAYGRLTVLSQAKTVARAVRWLCRCDCGAEVVVTSSKLGSGHTRSCGCLRLELASSANLKHGHSAYPNGGQASKEYNAWCLMIRRCAARSGNDFRTYAERGITVCERWRTSFENFLLDMGPAPSARHSIDRINNDLGYEPANCRWASPMEQRRNQRRVFELHFRGQSKTPAEWARELGISNKRIHARIKRGWSVERALSTPTS